jgi:peptidoglycan/xylan/chitin deacetylase (PgdA/CDA1 family)
LKHGLKRALRGFYARVLWHTGLARLVDRCSAPRLTILYGHCVADEEVNGELAPEMKVSERRLEHLLRVLGQRFELVTIGEGMARLADGSARRSMVALSMDDGYRDNLTRLVPLLERTGARATIFLEAGPVVERRLGWLHTFEWLAVRLAHSALRERLAALAEFDANGVVHVRAAGDTNALKRALKYELRPDIRDGALAALARQERCDEVSLVERLYLDAAGARALVASGRVEIGGHTVDHPVLAKLPPGGQRREIEGGRERLREALGPALVEPTPLTTFAYPYGRTWDFDVASCEAVRAAGFRWAVTTHAGTNSRSSDPLRLRRWPIEEHTPLHVLGVEASGGFEILRRRGIDLIE